MKNKTKKLSIKKCVISNLDMHKVSGGNIADPFVAGCNPIPTAPNTVGTNRPTGEDVITFTDRLQSGLLVGCITGL